MQKMRLILAGGGGAVALSLAAAAFALGPGGHDPMAMFDTDGNGAMSLAEVRQGAQAMFAKVDSDKDGRLSHDEMRAHHRMMGGRHPGKGGPHKAGGPTPGDHGTPGGRGPMHMDTDGDGAISLAEAQSMLEGHFTRADANRDGSVTRAEMEAAHRDMHGRR
jgi:hypothetical protein